jgi:hypothetical protein
MMARWQEKNDTLEVPFFLKKRIAKNIPVPYHYWLEVYRVVFKMAKFLPFLPP